jgi:subtilase family serine protease
VLDPALTYVKTVSDNDFVCGFAGGVLTCTGGSLDGQNDQDPGHDDTATIEVFVKAPLLHSYGATLQTRVDPDGTIPESIESNNSNASTVTVTSKVDLQVDVADAGLSSATEGDWEFTAKNTGTEAASNVTVEFDLAVGTIPLNVQAPNASWSCQITENPISEVTCTTANLGAGASDTFTVHVYTTAQGETIHSSAVIDPANTVVETNESNNTDQGSASV